MSRYQFNTKQKDQLFCGKCGASIGIDFREFLSPGPSRFGISVSVNPTAEVLGGGLSHTDGLLFFSAPSIGGGREIRLLTTIVRV